MNYLAIDASGKNLTIIICKDGITHSYYDEECGVNHSVKLMPKIEELANKINFDFSKADFFCAVVGAGSFTGIRIGISTIKAMCFAFNKPCLSITSFDTLAYNEKKGKILSLIDAKHNAFYACGYQDGAVVIEPCYIDKDKVKELLKEYCAVSSTKLDDIDAKQVDICQGLINAIKHKKDKTSWDLESLEPLYVRKSQAEEGR